MGSTLSSPIKRLFAKKQVKIMIVGLDAAGKTTMLYKMKLGEVVTTIPTIGMFVENVEYKNMRLMSVDLGGRGFIRPLMRHYYPNTDAVVFVLDSSDKERLPEVKEEIWRLMEEDDLRFCPILFLANKQDLQDTMSTHFLVNELDLHKLRNRSWYIQTCSATTGEGLYEGFDWLSSVIGYKKAKEYVRNTAAKTVADNKTVTKGWEYAVCGIRYMRNWIWGEKNQMVASSPSA